MFRKKKIDVRDVAEVTDTAMNLIARNKEIEFDDLRKQLPKDTSERRLLSIIQTCERIGFCRSKIMISYVEEKKK